MDQLFDAIVALLNLDAATLMGVLAFVAIVAQFVGRVIPDNKTGILGFIRKVSKVLGLYVSNRLNRNESTSSVAKSFVNNNPDA